MACSRDRAALETAWLHCLTTTGRGKTSVLGRRLRRLLRLLPPGETPFTQITLAIVARRLDAALRASGIAQFDTAIRQSLFYDLATCTESDLRKIKRVTADKVRRFVAQRDAD